MKSVNVTQARQQIYSLIDLVNTEHEPIQINGKRGNAVLVSEEDWGSIRETLYLMSIEGMRESIVKGMKIDPKDCDDKVDW